MKPGDPEARPEESGTESGTESGEEAIAFAVLGASNLTHAFPQAIRAIVRRLPNRPAILHVAHGPGRSYGLDAGILGITFRGHRESVLRERIDAERGRVKLEGAILTDIGNDIPYEVPVPTILEWVGEIVRSLVSRGARVGITRLPVEAVRDLPSWRFRMLLPLFYPRCRLSREEIFARMVAVEQGLEEIAARMPEVELLPVRREWYGFDRFHLRSRARAEAWREWTDRVLASRSSETSADRADDDAPSLLRRPFLRFLPPEEYAIFGRRRGKRRKAPIEWNSRVRLYVY